MTADQILIVGAGPAGLAASACLRQQGLAHTIIEREHQITSTWHRHYDRLHLHTVKKHSALPLGDWPADTPKYPSRIQVLEYFENYAKSHEIEPLLGVTMQQLHHSENQFLVQTSRGTLHTRFVVIATGYNSLPK